MLPQKAGKDPGKRVRRQIIIIVKSSKVKPLVLLHRTKFTGNYNYNKVKDVVGKLFFDQGYTDKAIQKGYLYPNKALKKLRHGTLTFLFKGYVSYDDPTKAYFKPNCIVETSNSTPELLFYLNSKLPELNIFSLEYAIDFFPKDPARVSDLFYIFRRYMFFNRALSTSMAGGKFGGWREPREFNAVYRVFFTKKNAGKDPKIRGKYVKIYERGPNHTKSNVCYNLNRKTKPSKGWYMSDTDRVRLEFTFSNRNKTLKSHGLEKLDDLISKGPKFHKILMHKTYYKRKSNRQDQIRFVNFIDRDSNTLPKDYEDYTSEDSQGNFECFMEEYLQGRGKVKNIAREIEDNKHFNPLKRDILKAMIKYQKKWRKSIKKLTESSSLST